MSSIGKHIFEEPGWGSLEIEIDESKRNFFEPTELDRIPFSIKGFGKSFIDYPQFFFFEWQNIHFSYFIEKESSFFPPFAFIVNDRIIKKSSLRGNNHLLSGQFSFADNAGETKIEIRDNTNKLIFEIYTEVFPQKMDYKSDYKAMMADISSIIENLAYDALKDTFKSSKARLKGHSTVNEWWNILDALFDQLVINLGVIKRQPKHEIKTTEKVLSVDKVKNASKNIAWFRKNSQYSNSTKGLEVLPGKFYSHAISGNKYITYDTYENRFVAWAIKNIIEQLREYVKYIESVSGSKDYSSLINRIKKYQGRLQGILHESPYREAGEFEKRSHYSTSLTRGAGYRDFMHIYLLLSRGLELADNDIFKIEQKNISTLYEYWCFLKLVQLLKEQNFSNIEFQDLIKIKANKFKVDLKKGLASKVTFRNTTTDESTTIYFNREFKKEGKKVFTYNQRPDYSIEFKKKGYDKPFWYLLDAKYRFDEVAESITNNYNVPQDAIGQLHRYRDAILHTEPGNSTYRGAIKNLGGIILYPYPLSEIKFTENVFYKSIDQVNIGALPFLPSKSSLVSDLLNKMINKTLPEEHFERFIEMDNSEYKNNRKKWEDWITVGVIPKKHQAQREEFIIKNQIFHIPYVKNLNSKIYLSEKVLLCKSGTKKADLYDVVSWEILSDKELKASGVNWNMSSTKYLVFNLKHISEIKTPEKLAPRKFRYTTSEGFRMYQENPIKNKKYFYLTNPDAARLYQELEKIEIQFKINWGKDDNDPSLIKFIFNQSEILSSAKFPDLHFKLENQLFSLNILLKKIRHSVG